jgi:hypothetical protein
VFEAELPKAISQDFVIAEGQLDVITSPAQDAVKLS